MAARPQGMVRKTEKKSAGDPLSLHVLSHCVRLLDWVGHSESITELDLDLIIVKGIYQMQNILLYSMQYVMCSMSLALVSKMYLRANYLYATQIWLGLVTGQLFSFFGSWWPPVLTAHRQSWTFLEVSLLFIYDSCCRHPSILIISMTAPFRPNHGCRPLSTSPSDHLHLKVTASSISAAQQDSR